MVPWLCDCDLDLSSCPKISVKILSHALHATRVQSGKLWKNALKSHVCHNKDQAFAHKWAGSASLVLQILSCPVQISRKFIDTYTFRNTLIYISLVQVEMFLLLQISRVLLSNLSSDFQITVHLFSSSNTVLWTVYAFNLCNLYCFCIAYTVLYIGNYRVLRLCALPHSSADFVVTAIKRLQRYFRLVLELKRLTTRQGVLELNTKRFPHPLWWE